MHGNDSGSLPEGFARPDKTFAGPSKFVSRRKRLGPVYLPRQAYGRAPLAIIVRVWIRNEDL